MRWLARRAVLALAFALTFASLTGLAAGLDETPFTAFDLPSYFLKSRHHAPPRCVVLAFVDGLGDRHADLDALDGLAASPSWWRGHTVPPPGDSSLVVRGLRGGCASPPWTHHAENGAAYGLLTTKCANDGTAAGFLVTSPDRYDLDAVSSAIASLAPAPYLVSGGFSRPLWSSARTVPFVEFDTSGASAHAERCEYPPADTFRERAARALRLGVKAGGARGVFLTVVDADVDMASHAGDAARVNASLAALRDVLEDTADALRRTCVGAWRVVVVGSHATGGAGGDHRHHSPPGTPVPVFVAGRDEHGRDLAQTMRARKRDALAFEEVARAVAPRLACAGAGRYADPTDAAPPRVVVRRPDASSPDPQTRSAIGAGRDHTYHTYHGTNKYAYDEGEVFVYLFFLFLTVLLFCSCVALPTVRWEETTSRCATHTSR